jgi:hypothetical protein
MDPDSLDVRSSVTNFLMDSQDEQSDLETSDAPNGSHRGDWRAVKARVESQARSHLKIPPTENKVRKIRSYIIASSRRPRFGRLAKPLKD